MSIVPVLIIGAGPVGLAASMALSCHGIQNIVLEKHPSTSIHPKARGVNVRTMELCRVWGVEQQIRQAELPAIARRFLWMDCIKGEIRGSVSLILPPHEVSPTEPCLLSQDVFEKEFLNGLKTQNNSRILFNTRVVDIQQDDQFVTCELLNLTDNTRTQIQCRYLIAADGANSFVRKALGVNMQGIPCLGHHVSVYCETDLSPWLTDKPFAVMTFTDKAQIGRFVMAVDLKRKWIFGKRIENPHETLTPEQAIKLVRATVDEPKLDVNFINISKWEMAALNAEKYRQGRIFLCGDAAHRIPPTGGMGMNTGIGDAHNLAWKIAYVIHGYADETLLESYEQERKPLAQTTIDWSVENANRLRTIFQSIVDEDEKIFQAALHEQSKHVNHLGLDIGFIYRSNAIYSNRIEAKVFDPNAYESKAIVGMRAPHCWVLRDNQPVSTLDLFETDYVLLAGENCVVNELKLPIPEQFPRTTLVIGKDLHIYDQDFYSCFQVTSEQAILIRPDGHVAWIG
ncbi:hypothetical protein CbuD7D7780_04360 [Coxiella burnetii]|uniref:FAD-binding domain-containing protein n=1 Tax=Coxiella burnetii (strain Dugway 5J108-111) TaxID=434922 RepID=A9KFD9_COXBN|nr:FAD-dependent monooxygenase [Coxiella burnetii]ABS77628.1 hypothetical protein CBUD_0848 [Coxiella burnetii Dugway 5J108-111]OYK80340.1 hypothetical protein CbuD7E6568_04340 [Coxiella burnetii]OYK82460.1 hypothetical protein CbuD7D7780_04360 [Coxiella burnetii]